jgi:hypothetical protein
MNKKHENKQTNEQTNKRTNKQMNKKHENKQTNEQTNKRTNKQMCKQKTREKQITVLKYFFRVLHPPATYDVFFCSKFLQPKLSKMITCKLP